MSIMGLKFYFECDLSILCTLLKNLIQEQIRTSTRMTLKLSCKKIQVQRFFAGHVDMKMNSLLSSSSLQS